MVVSLYTRRCAFVLGTALSVNSLLTEVLERCVADFPAEKIRNKQSPNAIAYCGAKLWFEGLGYQLPRIPGAADASRCHAQHPGSTTEEVCGMSFILDLVLGDGGYSSGILRALRDAKKDSSKKIGPTVVASYEIEQKMIQDFAKSHTSPELDIKMHTSRIAPPRVLNEDKAIRRNATRAWNELFDKGIRPKDLAFLIHGEPFHYESAMDWTQWGYQKRARQMLEAGESLEDRFEKSNLAKVCSTFLDKICGDGMDCAGTFVLVDFLNPLPYEWAVIEKYCRPQLVLIANINLPGHAGWIARRLLRKSGWQELLVSVEKWNSSGHGLAHFYEDREYVLLGKVRPST